MNKYPGALSDEERAEIEGNGDRGAPLPNGPGDYGLAGDQTPPGQDESDIDGEERDLNCRIVEAPALAYDPEPQRLWIVEDVIPDENLTLITGEGGIGKTTIAEQLAVAARTNGYWLGMPVTQGPVLFLTSEDERKDVHISMRAILKGEGKNLAHCPGLHILSLADRDACLAAASTKLAAITATPLWHALLRLIERIKPRIVIFDALADLFGGEENARRQVRGILTVKKVQYAQEGTVFRLRRMAGFFAYEAKDGGAAPYDRAAAAAKAETAFLAILQSFEDQGRSVSPNPSGSYAPVVFEREADADGFSKAAFRGAMSRLLKANRIHIEKTGPASRQRDKLAPGPATAH
jgi:AAA domain